MRLTPEQLRKQTEELIRWKNDMENEYKRFSLSSIKLKKNKIPHAKRKTPFEDKIT